MKPLAASRKVAGLLHPKPSAPGPDTAFIPNGGLFTFNVILEDGKASILAEAPHKEKTAILNISDGNHACERQIGFCSSDTPII